MLHDGQTNKDGLKREREGENTRESEERGRIQVKLKLTAPGPERVTAASTAAFSGSSRQNASVRQ